MSKVEFFPGPYFPVFGLNISVLQILQSTNLRSQSKYGPEKNKNFETSQTVTNTEK